MAYHMEIDEVLVLDYLCHADRGLSETDLNAMLDFLEDVGRHGDVYRNDPSRRCAAGSPHFEATYLFIASAGKVRVFRFIVSDAAAAYGVLRVRFAEEL